MTDGVKKRESEMFTQGAGGVDSPRVCADLAARGCIRAIVRHVSGPATTQPSGVLSALTRRMPSEDCEREHFDCLGTAL